MIKKLLSLVAIMVAFNLDAQITLTEATHVPNVGFSAGYVFSSSFSYSPGPGGANQTWDLSGMSGSSAPFTYISLANSSQSSYFPNANLVETVSGLGENYYRKNASEFSYEGHYVSGQARIVYTDRREFLKFPLNYQDTYNETFAGSVDNLIAGQTFMRSGNIEITADSYGDLILPYGTVSNVLRVLVVNDYSDTYLGTPFFNYVDTLCFWFNPGTKTFIASTTTTYANGNKMIQAGYYIQQSDLSTSGIGLTENTSLKERISFAPNPSNGIITLNNETEKSAQFEVIDFSGAIHHSSEISTGETTFDLSHLKSGIYLVRYIQGGQTTTEKLVIE